jgi:serine/threonine protein kinase
MSDDEHKPAEASLRDRLQACQRGGLPGIPPKELLLYVRDVAQSLDALHSQSLLYRDVKPDNILVRNGHAELADSGMLLPPLGKAVSAGTPAYMAPEAWRGKAGARSDQYSLALSYAELRCGCRPFPGRGVMEVMRQHLEDAPELASFPATEQQVLLKALAKDPEQRYPSCLTFVQELERGIAPPA